MCLLITLLYIVSWYLFTQLCGVPGIHLSYLTVLMDTRTPECVLLCWCHAPEARVSYCIVSLSCLRGSFGSGTLQHVLLAASCCLVIAATKMWQYVYYGNTKSYLIRILCYREFFVRFPHKVPWWLVTVQRLPRCYLGGQLPRKRNSANAVVSDFRTNQRLVAGYRSSVTMQLPRSRVTVPRSTAPGIDAEDSPFFFSRPNHRTLTLLWHNACTIRANTTACGIIVGLDAYPGSIKAVTGYRLYVQEYY